MFLAITPYAEDTVVDEVFEASRLNLTIPPFALSVAHGYDSV
jgi:hypothetical protein